MIYLPWLSINNEEVSVRFLTQFPFERSVVHWIRENNRTRKIICHPHPAFCYLCHRGERPTPRWKSVVFVNNELRNFEFGPAIFNNLNNLNNLRSKNIRIRKIGMSYNVIPMVERNINIDSLSEEHKNIVRRILGEDYGTIVDN